MIKICNIHFELPRREPKANFWLTDRLIPTENKKKIFFSVFHFSVSPATYIFRHQSGHKHREHDISSFFYSNIYNTFKRKKVTLTR